MSGKEKTTMKLYIFEPSRYWNYCSGMAIATANSLQEAGVVIQNKETEDGSHETFQFLEVDFSNDPGNVENVWVLTCEVLVPDNQPPICKVNYEPYGL
jgi:hypothetical protein